MVSDYFTKWVECYALPDQRAETTADVLVTQFFCQFGISHILHSDQGANFESRLFQEMCRLLEIRKTRTTPYHARSDGLVERFNGTIQQMLKSFVDDRRSDWDDHLPYLCMAYRSTEHSSTGFSPNKLMLGREVSLPVDPMYGKPPGSGSHQCYTEYVQWFSDVTEECYAAAREHLGRAAVQQKPYFDIVVLPRQYSVDQLVWYFYPPKQQKLGSGWVGPFRVTEKCSEVLYHIRNVRTGYTRGVLVDKLRPFHGDPGVCEGFRDGVADSIAGSVDESTERPMHEEELQLPSLHSTDEDNEDRQHTGRRPRRTPAYLDDFIVGCVAMDGELPNVWNGVDHL